MFVVFSKYAWLRPLEDKKGQSVAKALGNIVGEGRQHTRIRTDRVQEFRAREDQFSSKEKANLISPNQ